MVAKTSEHAMRRTGLQFVAAAFLLLGANSTFAADYPPRVGQPHPDFTLPDIEDRAPVSLAQFRGRKVLLIQFASW
jgi:hypothetical protein